MKKVLLLLICFCFLLTSCSMIYYPKKSFLLEYYANDANYDLLTGTVTEFASYNDCELGIKVEDPKISEYIDLYENSNVFVLYTHAELRQELNIGDVVTFMSAPAYVFDGHAPPIVYLERNGVVMLTFEEGKDCLLNYVENEMFRFSLNIFD